MEAMTTVLPVHRLSARELLFRATVENGLCEMSEWYVEAFVRWASVALAEGLVMCVQIKEGNIICKVWKP